MSGFAGSGQFNDTELERQLQDEYRRRLALQPGAAVHARQPDYGAMLGIDASTSPYYARSPAAYPRLTTPYPGLDARAYPPSQQPDAGPLVQLYAAQQRRQQQAVQQAAASSYGFSPGAAAYGAPSPVYGSSALDAQRYAQAYGLPGVATDSYGRQIASYGAQPEAAGYGAAAIPQATSSVQVPFLDTSGPPLPPPSKLDKLSPESLKIAVRTGRVPSPRTIRKEMAPGGTANKSALLAPPPRTIKDGKIELDDGVTFYIGNVPLGLDDDKYWLSELQVFLRANFAEAFAATEEDIAAPMHGRNKPIALGQVGIRCKHCKNDNPAERGQQATSYPSLISGIYNSVQQMLRLHLDCCLSMPKDTRNAIEKLKVSCSSRGGRKQYWIDSARRLGLVDTTNGIHFGRDPYGPMPPLSGPSVNSKEGRRKRMLKATAEAAANKKAQAPEPEPQVEDRPLVFDEDRPLISDYLYLTLEQMAPCTLMEADRVGCYKTRKVGFPGLACKHCVGQAGCGRYFPASEASLSQTTTSQTIMNHVRNCRRCPAEIRENLEIMKRDRIGPDGKRADKPKHGGRKVFFHRLWCRIQGLEIQEDMIDVKESKPRKLKKGSGRKKRDPESDEETEDEDDDGSSEEATESEEESDDGRQSRKKRGKVVPQRKKPPQAPWFPGCVRMTKTDDPHWLSEMECFARSDLIEVFSLDDTKNLDGYGGRREPQKGQVGVRCVFCKNLDPPERPTGSLHFPDSISTLHTKVTDMIRLHFPSCPALPDEARGTFKSLRGFDAKVANDDAQQYWVDACRDIGLSNLPPGTSGKSSSGKSDSWGITFRRDPLQPSPADELDLEASNGNASEDDKNALVKADDRGLCTDQVMLLMKQVQPCRFKKSDRRAGPGYRGRDRSMGFPGLACIHCSGQNTLGRYFPVSAKNMTDCTSNSLLTHVQSCTYCPLDIRASLAYLGHRSILQKAELRGCWKKMFFKLVWDRLHVERKWTINDNEDDGYDHGVDGEEEEDDGSGDNESESEKEELGENMNALIKAAAIWLTEQDAATDTARAASRATKGRALPSSKRPASGSNGSNLPKRRRTSHA